MVKIAKHDRPEDLAVIELIGQERYSRMREIVEALIRNPLRYSLLEEFSKLVNELPAEQRDAVRQAVLRATR